MVGLRWAGRGTFSYEGELFAPGETVDVDEETADDLLDHWSDGWERADETQSAEDGDDSEAVDAPLNPSEYTVADLEDELEGGDYSADDLDAIESAEQDGKDRETALEAIDDARGN